MANRKPLLMNKVLYNFLKEKEEEARKDVFKASETPEKMLKTLQGIFCKGRYQSWILSPKTPQFKNPKKRRKNYG